MQKLINAIKQLFGGRSSSLDDYITYKNPSSLAELESLLKELERKTSLRTPLK